MNRKQSHEPLGSYPHSQNPKIQYHVSSPYIQLLQSKKKGEGYRYDTKNIRSFTNYSKPSPVSISSIFVQGPKPFKSISTQKVKVGRSATNDKKKRNRTQEGDQKMHESMCVYQSIHNKSNQQSGSKSLYYGVATKQSCQLQPPSYLLQTNQKKRKRHLSDNKHNHQSQNNNLHNLGPLENLNISDIDGLISLIDTCVHEANQYISYLLEKLEVVKEELILSKAQITQIKKQNYNKDIQINEKDQIICSLQKQLRIKNGAELVKDKDGRKQNGFEIKNLLQIIQKISEENQKLRTQLQSTKTLGVTKIPNEKQREGEKQKDPRRDFYNEIHSKIDILNISIDNNHGFNRNEDNSDGKEKRDKEISKKYKFIKPRNR